MPSNDVELLRYRSYSELPTSVNLSLATAEDSPVQVNTRFDVGLSMISLSKTRVSVGDNVTVYWDIRGNILCGANDWIGLFELDSPMSLSNYLDYKQRGVTVARRGAIKWAIKRDVTLGEVEKKCIFKYIHASTGSVKAVSPTLYIHNPFAELTAPRRRQGAGFVISQETLLEFSVAGLQANGLKKNIFGKPSPYVKLSIMPLRRHRRSWKQHHGQIAKTSSQSNTINPKWNSEEFVFLGGTDDLLEVEVRNKFSGARPTFSRFLGKLSIPLVDLFEQGRSRREEVTKRLGKRTPADRIQGSITLTLTIIVPRTDATLSSQQENVPPSSSMNVASNASPQRSVSAGCALSNLSLMSSAPNILQPLTLNSGNGVLETIFPVDTPSPVSPYGFMEEESEGNNTPAPNCRRQLHLRPFSEMYSGGFMPLDINLLTQESSQSSEQSHVANEEASSGHEDVDGAPLTSQHSVENDSADAFAVQEVEEVRNDSGMPLESSSEHVGNGEGLQNTPMEIPEENLNTFDSGIAVLAQTGVRDEEMTGLNRGDRNSVASIELTIDSDLRILEESERVRVEEIALSSENLHDNAVESDDEAEEMEISEASVTDDSVSARCGNSPLIEESMRNSSDFNSTTSTVLDGSGSLVNQVIFDTAASEHSLNTSDIASEEDLVETGVSSLVEGQEPTSLQHPLNGPQGPSGGDSPTVESERIESAASMELEEQPTDASASTRSASEPSESTVQQLEGDEGETHPSILEYVNHIVGDDSRSLQFGNDSSAMTTVESVRTSDSSQAGSSEAARNCLQSSLDSDSNLDSSLTLPLGASEAASLDLTSLQPPSATEMSVDSQPTVGVTTSVDHRHVSLQSQRDEEDPSPSRPPRVKRISRSSSEPISTQPRTRGERIPNTSSGAAAAAARSPRISRPQLDGRSSSMPQSRELIATVGAGTSGGVDVTSTEANTSAVESVVVAMPLLSPPLQAPSSSGPMPVVVADVMPEAMALVTPVLSPDFSSETQAVTTNSQSTVFAVPLNPEENRTTRSGSLRLQDHSQESRDGYVVIVPVDCGQTSSAPSTLRRNDAIANASSLTSMTSRTTPNQHQNVSHGNSPVIYATPLFGQGSEGVTMNCSSFPRQSTTTVNSVSAGRRRSSSSSSSGAPSRLVSESSSVAHRVIGAKPLSNFPAPGDTRRDARQIDESRTSDTTVVSGYAGTSTGDFLGGSVSLPVASTSAPQQPREQIQTLLKTNWFANSSQLPHKPSPQGQTATTSQGTTSSRDPERGRKRPPLDSRSGSRRGSGRRPQGQPVHVSIRDQQQTGRQQVSQEQQNDEPLPRNWERGVDSHGRVYYIDHVNRTTTWNRPRRDAPESELNMNDMNTHWQSLDRRYESFRRTLRGRSSRNSRPPLPMPNRGESQTAGESSGNQEGEVFSPRASDLPSASASSAPETSTPSPSPACAPTSANLSHAPAVKFLTRSDFIDFLNSKGLAGQYYFQSQMLKLIVSKIRSDPSQFDRYRHQVELVRFLNQFADPQMEIPPGWDKKVDQNGRLYFINHNSRTTTFIDPRLPMEENTLSRNRAETEPRQSRVPPPRPPPPRTPTRSSSIGAPSTNLTYNQQVVGFLSQPNIDDILKQKHEGYARNPTLKANVRRVQSEGERALSRLSNNLDFVMLLSVLEDSIVAFVPPDATQSAAERSSQPSSPIRESASAPIFRGGRTRPVPYEPSMKSFQAESTSSTSPAPYKRDFEAKVRSFHRQLYQNGYGQGPNKIKLSIRRDHILEDAFDQIMKEPARALKRNRLEIQFAGEEGLDYGGPAREFFFLLSRQLFNPYYGLFEYSANDTYTVQVSPVSLYVDNSHEWFSFCGRIIGLVIIHQHLLDAFFTRPFYKALLRSACDLSDVEALDSLFHQSMTWVMENDITGALDLSFTVSEEIFGQVTERELVTGGKEIEVNERNKQEYVEHMVRWRVDRGVSEQMESIVNGFSQVLELNLISIFDARELELVISGTADIDIKDWRKNTEYRSGYHDNHKVVKWFWKAVTSFDNEQKLRLLQFVTGTSSIPYEGFAALRGSTGPRKFCIERWGESSKLPRAHTCFNRLDLPVYRSFDELLEKLTFAVEESETFSMQ